MDIIKRFRGLIEPNFAAVGDQCSLCRKHPIYAAYIKQLETVRRGLYRFLQMQFMVSNCLFIDPFHQGKALNRLGQN